jgi:hypothetical protein
MKPWRVKTKAAKPASGPEGILLRANALFRPEPSKELRGRIAEKIEQLRGYDVLGMERVVAILMWGRSGSLLLSSYLDGHDDVIMLPDTYGQGLYYFFERYQSLSLRDKLIAYPAFEFETVDVKETAANPRFFDGAFAISAARYYAAVQAIHEFYGELPPDFLASRRAFFLFVHIAYNLALGRRPASSRPLMVHAQHEWDNVAARQLVEDFPQAKFVHTIRDPISSCDGVFHYHFKFMETHLPTNRFLPTIPYMALYCLTNKDRPHCGMESRTRAIRFEDLHSDLGQTMRDLSEWLGLPYQATLLDSTFNGIPWVVTRDGKAWSGRRSEQVQRRSGNLSPKDRALMFAVFYENFVDWGYPCPKIFGHAVVRCIVFVSLFLFPTKMEITAARAVIKHSILPSLRHGDISRVITSLRGIGVCRLKIIWRLARAFFRRYIYGTALLQLDGKRRTSEHRDDGAGAARNEA